MHRLSRAPGQRGYPVGASRQPKLLTSAQIERVDRMFSGTHVLRNRALFFLQLATGLRVGALAALNVGDVLRAGGVTRQFHLERTGTRHGQPRTVYLENEKARRALHVYLCNRRPRLDFNPGDPLFVGQKPDANGDYRLTANTLAHLFPRFYRDAGIVGASSDSGRRWFLGQLVRAGIRDTIIQKRAGHAHVSTTRRYLTATTTDERRAVRAIDF